MSGAARWTALVLAAGRGPDDPLARAAGVSHKAIVAVGGVPMIARVVASLRGCQAIGTIVVSIEREGVLAGVVDGVMTIPSGPSASASVMVALERLGTPLLVTTADHALLTPATIERFLAGIPADVDVAAGIVPAALVSEAYPGIRRTFLSFRDRPLKGANLFAFLTPDGRRVAAFWARTEAFRKRPLRLIRELGVWPALLFALGRLTVDAAVRRLASKTDVRLALVEIAIAEAAIDVDKPKDLALAERILRARAP